MDSSNKNIRETNTWVFAGTIIYGAKCLLMFAVLLLLVLSYLSKIDLPFSTWFRILFITAVFWIASFIIIGEDKYGKFTKSKGFAFLSMCSLVTKAASILMVSWGIIINIALAIIGISRSNVFSFPMLLIIGFFVLCTSFSNS